MAPVTNREGILNLGQEPTQEPLPHSFAQPMQQENRTNGGKKSKNKQRNTKLHILLHYTCIVSI